MLKIVLNSLLLSASIAASVSAQSFVQISSVRARPVRLTCVGPGATSYVRVQVYIAGVPEKIRNSAAIRVSLSTYSAHPSISKIEIRDAEKEVALIESPMLVDFEVNCTSDTLPGVLSLGATIAAAPDGILIKEPVEAAIVDLEILRPRP